MVKNYIKIALRNATKNGKHTAISLASLILGLVFSLLITVWVKDELSYDKGFKDADKIYRVETNTIANGTNTPLPTVGWPVGMALKTEYPEIAHLTYIALWKPIITFKGLKFYEDAFYADSSFFSVFGYELAEGNTANALKEPFSLVISEKLKEKYFADGNAIGKVLMLNDTIPYKITGVFKDLSKRSHLKFDMIGSFASYCSLRPEDCQREFASGWFDVNVFNYVKLKDNVDGAGFSQKIKDLVLRDGKAVVEASGFKCTLMLRPIEDIYLKSGMSTGNLALGNIKMVRLFILIGIFILVIACLNFINLTTAKSIERAKEIGVKKVLGIAKGSLIIQFLFETALMCLAALIISMVTISFLVPLFNQFTGKDVSLPDLFSISNLLLMFIIVTAVIPLAGFYPAWVLSSFRPIRVLKGSFAHTSSGEWLRKGLVIFQFAISVTFIVSTFIILKQMRFMDQQDLGFDKERVLLVTTDKVPRRLVFSNAQVYKNEVLRMPGIITVTACAAVPGRIGWDSQYAIPEGRSKEQASIVEYIPVDDDYVKTLGFKFASGRDFIKGDVSDQKNNLIINESAATAFGWNSANAIGKRLATSGKDGIVIGVLKNYHQHGLQETIKPVVLGEDSYASMFAIRYHGSDPTQPINAVKDTWKRIFPGYQVDYKFMDADFQAQYQKDEQFKILFELAAALSILIASLGLLGLAIFSAQKRIKEIGIRKVLGASIFNITVMLSSDFIKLIIISIILATPVAWFSMNNWLQNYAYRTNIPWWLFPLAGLVAILIALLTICFQSVKAALTNPVKSLKSE